MKNVMLTLVVLSCASWVMAQEHQGDRGEAGIIVALNVANVTGSDVTPLMQAFQGELGRRASKASLTGAALGVFYSRLIRPGVAVEVELLYSQRGFVIEVADVDVNMKVNYVEIPLLLKGVAGQYDARVHACFGPTLGIRVGASVDIEVASLDADELWAGADLGLVFGAGVEFPLGRTPMSVEARYTIGVTGVANDGPENLDIRNSTLSLLAGFGL